MTLGPTKVLELGRGPHWVVYDKHAGMTVVAGRGVVRPTLLDIAVEAFPQARPVHRLDKPTTGCCVIATSAFGQQALSDAFRRRLTDKRYVAIVEGLPSWNGLTVDAPLARIDEPDASQLAENNIGKKAGKKGPLAIQTVDEQGDRALTRLKVLARGDGVALVEARPQTGRMHQIRCHLAHVGFPIVGDALYGAKATFCPEQELALHAVALSFPRPEGGGRAFITAPTPGHWWNFAATHNLALGAVDVLRGEFVPRSPPAPAKAPAHGAGRGPKPSTTKSTAKSTARSAPESAPKMPPRGPSASKSAPKKTPRAPARGGNDSGRRGGATPPTSPGGPPRSKRGGGGARSGPSRRGGRPGR